MFTIADYTEEEEYLHQRHLEGWKFVNYTPPVFYTFEACEPEDVVYQLDFNPDRHKDKNSYLQIFKDCGWEYLGDRMDFSYFRKTAKNMEKREEIFSDNDSKLDMLRRVIYVRLLPLLAVFFLCFLSQLPQIFFSSPPAFVYAVFVLYCLLFLLCGWIVLKICYKYHVLKNQI